MSKKRKRETASESVLTDLQQLRSFGFQVQQVDERLSPNYIRVLFRLISVDNYEAHLPDPLLFLSTDQQKVEQASAHVPGFCLPSSILTGQRVESGVLNVSGFSCLVRLLNDHLSAIRGIVQITLHYLPLGMPSICTALVSTPGYESAYWQYFGSSLRSYDAVASLYKGQMQLLNNSLKDLAWGNSGVPDEEYLQDEEDCLTFVRPQSLITRELGMHECTYRLHRSELL